MANSSRRDSAGPTLKPPFSSNYRGGFRPFRNRMSSRDIPVKAEDILRLALKKHHIDRELDRYRFVLHWREIVGEDVARRATPECFRDDILFVRVANSAWAQELEFQKGSILARLKGYLARGCEVKDIRFLVEGRTGVSQTQNRSGQQQAAQAKISSTASSRRFTTPKTR